MKKTKKEIEVFRITPVVGKCYETAENTRKEGSWPNEKYYTINTPRYVGKFIKQIRSGWGDSASITDIFFNDEINKEVYVPLSYEGRTSYREVECKELEKRKKMVKFMTTTIDPNAKFKMDDEGRIGRKIMSNLLPPT